MKKTRLGSNRTLPPTPATSDTDKISPPSCQPKVVGNELALDSTDTPLPSQETLQLSLLFLMSKFALTQEKTYAEAAYQHLHMLAVRCDTDSKPRFAYRSLAMDWVQMCRGQITTDDKPRTGPH